MPSQNVNQDEAAVPDSDRLSVAVCCDEHYAMPLGVTLNSMLRSLKKDSSVNLYIICTNISDDMRIRLTNSCAVDGIDARLDFILPDVSLVDRFHVRGHMSKAGYYRLLLPDLLPQSLDKVIYLDSDLLVQGCLSDLWSAPIGNYALLAVEDILSQTVSSSAGLYNWRELGFAADDPYFNSGVLVIGLNKWRRDGITAKLLEYLSGDTSRFRCHDQEALNAVLGHEWGQLDLTWNSFPFYLQPSISGWADTPFKRRLEANFEELAYGPAICHYVSKKKPWIPGYRPAMQSEWLTALRLSGWFNPSEFASWYLTWRCRHYPSGIRNKIYDYVHRSSATH